MARVTSSGRGDDSGAGGAGGRPRAVRMQREGARHRAGGPDAAGDRASGELGAMYGRKCLFWGVFGDVLGTSFTKKPKTTYISQLFTSHTLCDVRSFVHMLIEC